MLMPHRRRLYRLALSRLHHEQDAEDCAQDALLRTAMFTELDVDRVEPFLTTTLLRLCVDRHRFRRRQSRLYVRVAEPGGAHGPEELVCDRAETTWLLRQLYRLRGREREVMLARAAGLSTAETAGHLGITVKAAEGAFTRARAKLRSACLLSYGDEVVCPDANRREGSRRSRA